jgi:hypothetical protein
MSKDDVMKKWAPIFDSMGLTGSNSETTSSEFPGLLPIAMKVAAKTISDDLIFASKEEIDAVKSRIQSENRDGKIESIVEGGEFIEKKLEDDQEYQKLKKRGVSPLSAPTGKLFYLDFKYELPKTYKKTRRSGKKNKKKNA